MDPYIETSQKINQVKRVKGNLITKDNQIPVLRGTSKDHKKAADEVIGPDFRAIMGATVGPNMGLSEIGSLMVRKIANNADIGLVAKSSDEVISKLSIKQGLTKYQG